MDERARSFEDEFCRLVSGAHLGHQGASAELRARVARPDFEWYRALAALHRQGLRAPLAMLKIDALPLNVAIELERAAELAQAQSVVIADRARRVTRALAVDHSVGEFEVRATSDEVQVIADAGRCARIAELLLPLEPAGRRPRDGKVNLLEAPRVRVLTANEPVTCKHWGDWLLARESTPISMAELHAHPGFAEAPPATTPLPPLPPFARPERAREILAIRVGGIGDVLFTLPALGAIKSAYPGARLSMLGASTHAALLQQCSGLIDQVLPFDWDLRDEDAARRERARQRFAAHASAVDLVIVFGPLVALAGIEHETPTLEVRMERGRGHTAQQYLDAVRAAGFAAPLAARIALQVDARAIKAARDALQARAPAPRRAVFFPGATTVYKCWPLESFAAVARALHESDGTRSVVFPAPDERAMAAALAQASAGAVDVIGEISLAELPAWIAACDLALGNDTGPTHLAATLGLPTLALFGFTDPGTTGPLGPRVMTLGGTPDPLEGAEELIRKIAPAAVLALLR